MASRLVIARSRAALVGLRAARPLAISSNSHFISSNSSFSWSASPAGFAQQQSKFTRSFASAAEASNVNPFASPEAALAQPAKSWSSGLSQQQQPVNIPWNIVRTAGQNLPVYTRIRNGGTRRQTVVRKVEGDVQAFLRDLQRLLGAHVTITLNQNNGNVVISGSLHAPKIKHWLLSLGL